ncbi:hypothetical protein DSM43518_03056 [Mycobacterium marinum]|uniref:Uncharacterized protein n=1 Tax=Mycobacterium shottsii TaxID=133549 RepID=A0A7I7LHB1_9MYCO|nr:MULTISPECIES: hypothetical protein [Mycobacterium ulcerans group]AXN44846.1 hypothetical protein MM1218R_02910 [Mycobacterium marinum]AXN50224.1 hypothetical protein CCUG20998_02819 [Mycobacterium marinum]EPQ80562.1 hypothetical protein MMEU_1087 [Mycobacterium marinum str. Europe]QYL28857.1 hypothetical protein TM48_03249 [Mycobacterium shottsii]RFZ03004.1 hypothetical protein VIMS_05398 [Mycobacterium marinum]
MTDPDMATILRNMKVPVRMTGSQALRDFLLIYVDDEESLATPERLKQLNGLLILSHLEVVNALGAMEAAATEQHVERFRNEINRKFRKRRWW